jgi:NhaP-type Na+/H+ or K+/H+ antiporter
MFVFKPTVCATLPAENEAKQNRRRLFAVTPIALNYFIFILLTNSLPLTSEWWWFQFYLLEYDAKLHFL